MTPEVRRFDSGGPSCYTSEVPVLLALGSALVYGVSDYLGGRTSRRWSPLRVAFFAELAATPLIALIVIVANEGELDSGAWSWGPVAGAAGGLGVLSLYAALAHGNMTVVAPVTGVVSASLPVAVGVLSGERPSALAVAGIAGAIVAVALIGGAIEARHRRVPMRIVALAVAAGFGFALLFVAYDRAGESAGLWPLLTARLGSLPVLAVAYALGRRRSDGRFDERFDRAVVPACLAIGTMIVVANGLYLWATRDGLLSVVAVLVSLYPASTIALASVLDGERPTRPQLGGMIVAAGAVVAISLGS